MGPPRVDYIYTRLPSATCIRLIEFLPSRPGEIAISLSAFELDNVPAFNALSYTWGDPRCPYLDHGPGAPSAESYLQATRTIRCDGDIFPVRPNLYDALRRIQAARSDVPQQRFLWIDAICIDQSSIAERSSQVQMMSRIFESAECIIAWIGPADDTLTDADSAVSKLAAVISGPLPSSVDEVLAIKARLAVLTEADFFDASAYKEKLGTRYITKREWLAFLAFLYRPYFERVWIVQEITLARRIVLLCGPLHLEWQDFAKAILCFLTLPQWVVLLNREILRTWISPESAEYVTFRRLRDADPRTSTIPLAPVHLVKVRVYARGDLPDGAKTPKKYGLRGLITTHRAAAATDPRDKVFALISLADPTKAPLTHPKAHTLAADYNLPVESVYTRLARLQILSFGDLRVLDTREADHMRAVKGLPSWVPDYSVWQSPENMDNDVPNCDWKAGGDETFTPDGRELGDPLLTLRGRRVEAVGKVAISGFDQMLTIIWGSIFDIVAKLPWDRFIDARLVKDPKNLDDPAPRQSVDVDSLPTPMEVLARTVTRDVLDSQSPAPADMLRDQFLAYAAEKYLTGWGGYGEYGDSNRSFLERLVGRWHRFNITHFDRSPGERRCTPIIAAFCAEPPDSKYNAQAFLDKANEYGEMVAAVDATRKKSVTGGVDGYDSLGGANHMNGGFKRQSQKSMASRTVFCTSDGLLLGLGPTEMHAGDELWVFAGAKTPSILRPTATGRYRFVGAAFVYGLMHGQAVTLFPEAWDIVLE
ncbi:heterokaryon incompatibility protein-domain-containing protein [Echria macrotheca]|uniref:Heterokaryon incompatibility protein-domain-containing protein n=1 Tax=Echria macrotheca TaxID=438768 RepID=A0AAJ0B7V8_9PEZI|nr:heterokaryon incompatibility protein-domain-containing protein [Echria macrotheca]